MKEASFVKFYFAKYFFLAFGLLQWLICGLILSQHGQVARSQFAAFVFFYHGLDFRVPLLVGSQQDQARVG